MPFCFIAGFPSLFVRCLSFKAASTGLAEPANGAALEARARVEWMDYIPQTDIVSSSTPGQVFNYSSKHVVVPGVGPARGGSVTPGLATP
ncbi:hypothetical protein RRG08_024822 [Elysia crispata]|uniref:Secreted protein n=1 Tax=Elysia crispata TaxID=231223 RepID=A0AAE0YJG6_9GAST|nr:hypothetical protein RRG08_024822 [Elysia crispata]